MLSILLEKIFFFFFFYTIAVYGRFDNTLTSIDCWGQNKNNNKPFVNVKRLFENLLKMSRPVIIPLKRKNVDPVLPPLKPEIVEPLSPEMESGSAGSLQQGLALASEYLTQSVKPSTRNQVLPLLFLLLVYLYIVAPCNYCRNWLCEQFIYKNIFCFSVCPCLSRLDKFLRRKQSARV